MSAECFDIVSAIFAVVSSILWGCSAFINLPFGYDMDTDLKRAFHKVGYLNAGGAMFAALAALTQAAKYFIM
jgi:hypothetical protein